MDQTRTRWIDRQVWRRQRRGACRKFSRSLGTEIAAVEGKDTRLLVIPHDGPRVRGWHPLGGNWFYEIYASAVDRLGTDRVGYADIPFGVGPEEWIASVLHEIRDQGATHVLFQMERDPDKSDTWNWDAFVTLLRKSGNVTPVAVHYDLHFGWIQEKLRRLHRLHPGLVSVGLADPPIPAIAKDPQSVGPVTMPVSPATIAGFAEIRQAAARQDAISFLGALYDDRVPLLNEIKQQRLELLVNPHHETVSVDYLGSRTNQPNYENYLRGLACTDFTINFARSSSGDSIQYKTRVIETALLGTFLITDDVVWTPRLFPQDLVLCVDSFADIPRALDGFLAQGSLEERRERLIAEGERLAADHFWDETDRALSATHGHSQRLI